MDGTLTEEVLDFDAIRRDVGVPDGKGVLEYISHLEGPARSRAQEVLHGHEIAGAMRCGLHEGAAEVLVKLKEVGVHRALLTRNSSICTEQILSRHNLSLDWVSTRDHLPHKPHADSVLKIVHYFGVSLEQTLMVGDFLYDMQAANNAGIDSALVHLKGGDPPVFAGMATYVLRRLEEVLNVVNGQVPEGVQ